MKAWLRDGGRLVVLALGSVLLADIAVVMSILGVAGWQVPLVCGAVGSGVFACALLGSCLSSGDDEWPQW